MKVFKRIMMWVGIVLAALLAIVLISAQIPSEFRDVGKGGVVDLFRYLIAQFQGVPFESYTSTSSLSSYFLPLLF